MSMNPKSEAWDSVEIYAKEVYNQMGGEVAVVVNFISDYTSYFPVFYAPCPGNPRPGNVTIEDPDFVISPRRANVCQHVIHRGETVEFVGMQNAPKQLTPSESQSLSQVDSSISSKIEKNKESGIVCDKENGCPFNTLWWDLQVNAASSVWYRGQPIFCNGSVIGAFCCVAPNGKPKDYDLRVKPLVEVNAARIGAAMERQALSRRDQYLSQLAKAKQIAGLPVIGSQISPSQGYKSLSLPSLPSHRETRSIIILPAMVALLVSLIFYVCASQMVNGFS